MKELVNKVLGNQITDEIAAKCKNIFPLENVTIRKVKSIKRQKIDINQLGKMHVGGELAGVKIVKKEEGQEAAE